MTTGRHRSWLAAFLLLIGAAACTATDDFLAEIGVTRLRLLDSDLAIQSIADPDGTIQAAEWTLSTATLTIDGEVADLLFDDAGCVFTDTAYILPQAEGRCDSGTILGANEEIPVSATLTLKFKMTVRRAKPFDVAAEPNGHFDPDDVPNSLDICPFADDPSQEDVDGDGIGDACSIVDPLTGLTLPDADGDGWEDDFDNCIWLPNPDQTDSSTYSDGIGDACPEESADIDIPATEIEIARDIEFTQLQNRINYLIVDFKSDSSLSHCTWSEGGNGSCTLNPAAIKVCINSTIRGCPSD